MKRIIICADGTWNLRDQVDEGSGTRAFCSSSRAACVCQARMHSAFLNSACSRGISVWK